MWINLLLLKEMKRMWASNENIFERDITTMTPDLRHETLYINADIVNETLAALEATMAARCITMKACYGIALKNI